MLLQLLLMFVPMCSFLTAGVVLVVHEHLYFGAAAMFASFLTIPKVELGGRIRKEEE